MPLTRLTWLGGIDPLSAATTTSPLDLDISVNGFQVLDLGTTAVATSGTGDIAIAFGANSTAIAEGGFGDYAFVFDPLGTVGSSAHAEGTFGLINNMDLAGVFGDMLHANATAGSNIIDITATPFG